MSHENSLAMGLCSEKHVASQVPKAKGAVKPLEKAELCVWHEDLLGDVLAECCFPRVAGSRTRGLAFIQLRNQEVLP